MFVAFCIAASHVAIGVIAADAAVFRGRRAALGPRLCCPVARLAYGATVMGAVGLAVTGIGGALGSGMHGWALILHCLGAPLFAVGLAIVAVSMGDACRFADPAANRFTAFEKALFWLICLAGLVVIGSAVLGLLKLSGTETLAALVDVHRYSAVVVTALLLVQAYRMLASRRPRATPAAEPQIAAGAK